MKRLCLSALAAALLATTTPGFAADLPTRAPAPVPPAPSKMSVSFEAGPSFSQKSGATFGQLSNELMTAGLSYVLAPNLTVNATLRDQIKNDNAGGTDSMWFLQGTIGYRIPLNGTVSLNVSGGVGTAFGTTGYSHGVASLTGTDAFLYYLGGAGIDVKLDPHWTWNAINVQYKNGFAVDYLTPFATTGVTYSIDGHNAVYAKATYNWSDYGLGQQALAPLSENFSIGYRYSF